MQSTIKKVSFSPEVLQMAKYTRAMSHPARIYILKKLSAMHSCCYSGNLVDELPIGRSSLSRHLKELKYAGLIQGETEPPFIKYCINRKNWDEARTLLKEFLGE